jgi:hypothetical protein
MAAEIRTTHVSGNPGQRQVVRLVLEYDGRLAHLEFYVEPPGAGLMRDDDQVTREFRKVMAALREGSPVPLRSSADVPDFDRVRSDLAVVWPRPPIGQLRSLF